MYAHVFLVNVSWAYSGIGRSSVWLGLQGEGSGKRGAGRAGQGGGEGAVEVTLAFPVSTRKPVKDLDQASKGIPCDMNLTLHLWGSGLVSSFTDSPGGRGVVPGDGGCMVPLRVSSLGGCGVCDFEPPYSWMVAVHNSVRVACKEES